MKIGITVDCIIEDSLSLNGKKHYIHHLYNILGKEHEVYYIINSKILRDKYKYEVENENFDIIIQYDFMIEKIYKSRMILLLDSDIYQKDMSEIMYGSKTSHSNVYYNLDDILKLFKLEYNFTEQDLKKAQRQALKTHPDKSNLPSEYFIFFKKAYKILSEI